MLREALYTEKVAFDVELMELPMLDKDQRLARWEIFLARLRPLAQTLADEEREQERLLINMAWSRHARTLIH